MNPDTSSYDGYEQGVKTLLEEVDAKLKIIKKSGAVTCNRGCGKGFKQKEICTAHWNIVPRTRSEDWHTACEVYPYSGILSRYFYRICNLCGSILLHPFIIIHGAAKNVYTHYRKPSTLRYCLSFRMWCPRQQLP